MTARRCWYCSACWEDVLAAEEGAPAACSSAGSSTDMSSSQLDVGADTYNCKPCGRRHVTCYTAAIGAVPATGRVPSNDCADAVRFADEAAACAYEGPPSHSNGPRSAYPLGACVMEAAGEHASALLEMPTVDRNESNGSSGEQHSHGEPGSCSESSAAEAASSSRTSEPESEPAIGEETCDRETCKATACGGALAIGIAELSYIIVLRGCLPASFLTSSSFVATVFAASGVAQVISLLILRAAEGALGQAQHSCFCRRDQAVYVFLAWVGQCGVFAAMLAVVFTCCFCPDFLLWLPLKRPAAATAISASGSKRKRARRNHDSVQPAAEPLRSNRYDASFWGLAWASRGTGPTLEQKRGIAPQTPAGKVQFELDCVVELPACRQLLTKLEAADLRRRLENSPYPRDEMPAAQSWLREAAEAFKVPLYLPRAGGRRQPKKSKTAVVEDVAKAVASAKASQAAASTTSRYSADVWGKTAREKGGRGKAVSWGRSARESKRRGAASNSMVCPEAGAEFEGWDLSACRALLVAIEEADLRDRLVESPWNQGQASADVNWLKEAAAAFDVVIKKGNSVAYRTKNDIVSDIVAAVRLAKALRPGTRAWRDEERRAARKGQMKTRCDAVRARNRLPLVPATPGQTFEQIREAVLLHECPEELRLAVAEEFVQREGRLPRLLRGSFYEDVAARYVNSALERRHRSEASGPQLREDEVAAWDRIFQGRGVEWLADTTFADAKLFNRRYSHLRPQKRDWVRRKRGALSEEGERDKAEDRLARELDVVRRAKVGDVWEYIRRPHEKRHEERSLLRRQLSPTAVAQWQKEVGDRWQWLAGREAEAYIPGALVNGSRFQWRREPILCQALGCYLCGEEFGCKSDLRKHWRERHIELPKGEKAALSEHRVEEEVRKRLFYDEAFDGPFEVKGQEMRRVVGTGATHQTVSVPGSGRINHDQPLEGAKARAMGGRAICARSFWLENLFELDLFVRPEGARSGKIGDVGGGHHGAAEAAAEDDEQHGAVEESAQGCDRRRFAVQPKCAEKVDKLLGVRRYSDR